MADADIEATMRGLLTQRQAALGIRSVDFTITRHLLMDPGCRRQAVSTARSYVSDHNYAPVLFDKVGSGDEGTERQRIQEVDAAPAPVDARDAAFVAGHDAEGLAGAVENLPVLAALPQLRPVRDPAFEDLLEGARIERP